MIDLTMDATGLEHAVERARERNIIIPTFAQQKHPELIPDAIKQELGSIGLWDITPRNLFRITWKNQPVSQGGAFGGVNYVEIPPELTGVDTRIIALVGKWFPTGAHKVGAAFGCLVPRLVTGQFDPTRQKAVWPSTGNYCRGGAYDSTILACESIAILPEGMSRERFDWLANVSGEVIATPGSESNVKEISSISSMSSATTSGTTRSRATRWKRSWRASCEPASGSPGWPPTRAPAARLPVAIT
jgi:hypothetical protein